MQPTTFPSREQLRAVDRLNARLVASENHARFYELYVKASNDNTLNPYDFDLHQNN
jgi:hypothetical protein